MDLGLGNTLLAGDPCLVDHIVGEVKSQGIFDQFRKECIADVDTKPAYQNLRTRVESSVNSFLSKQAWRADLNKNQLRETLRKHIHDAPYLDAGVERIVDQVVNPKVYSVFMPQIEDVVYKFLGLERPKTSRERNGPCRLKDLLPKDLDPVSPESDKNSLKDVSLDSVDANLLVGVPRKGEEASVAEEGRAKETTGEEEAASTKATDQSLNCSAKTEDKTEEEEEDSPTFEPIDIMNLNESNVSNDSHLSGISELTSHRSRSPDFSNETSRDNMDFSNQDSQLSKVSSDSRLSIVTDFGSSNHASTPLSDAPKDDKSESKYGRENFRAIREFEASSGGSSSSRSKDTAGRMSQEAIKDEGKAARTSVPTKETSRDASDASAKETREKIREASRSKSSREAKRDKTGEATRRSEPKSEKVKRTKERTESSRDSADKLRDPAGKLKEPRDHERKETGKESKDLKDMYKEKIRELRERKELTEKLGSREPRSSSRDTKGDSREVKRDSRDSSKSASSKPRTSRTDGKSPRSEGKTSRSESRGKRSNEGKRAKEPRNSHGSDSGDKLDPKRYARTEKDEKNEKSETRQDSESRRQKSTGKSSRGDSSRNSEGGKRESKGETEKKRREDKKSKVKDDHSSLRRNPDDRRSTDRDGSNDSNGRTSQKNNSGPPSASKSVASSLPKETATPSSNSSGETSDSVEEKQIEASAICLDSKKPEVAKIPEVTESSNDEESSNGTLELGSDETTLPIKKRPHGNENTEAFAKKPKFAKNFQEAKRLMKIRRRMERDELRRRVESEKHESVETPRIIVKNDELPPVPDEERVQIIEVRDEEYDEPYPEVRSDFTLEERSRIILGGEAIFTSELMVKPLDAVTSLSEMETSIRQSLEEMISDNRLNETKERPTKPRVSLERENEKLEESVVPGSSRSKLPGTEESSESLTEVPAVRAETKDAEIETPENVEANVGKAAGEEIRPDGARVAEIVPGSSDVERVPEGSSRIQGKVEETGRTGKGVEDEWEMKKVVEETPMVHGNVEGRVKAKGIREKDREIDGTVEKKLKMGDSLEGDAKIGVTVEKEAKVETRLGEDTKVDVEAPEDEKTSVTSEISTPEVVGTEKMARSEDTKSAKDSGGPMDEESASCLSEDEAPCLYFVCDNDRLERFSRFLKSLESGESSGEELQPEVPNEIVSSLSKSMAPPKPKRKYSTSPLTDILLNNANNNNDAHKNIEPVSDHEDTGNSLKKRKIGRPKKQKNNASLCSQQQSLSNGENFVMPLSPESDVSATSEKAPSNPLKDEKSRPRGSNQRYTSDDLYKPRPLFSSSSRRSRRSNQA